MAETGILRLYNNLCYKNEENESVCCYNFVNDFFESAPRKIYLSFSTRKSTEALCVFVWWHIFDYQVTWKISEEENFEDYSAFEESDMFSELERFLRKNYQITSAVKKLYVTVYDGTEA